MIQHDKSKKKFFIDQDNSESHLLYRFIDDESIDIYSTYVPQSHRGKGLAKTLVDSAVEYATNEGLKIKPSCSYVENYFDRKSELKGLLKD